MALSKNMQDELNKALHEPFPILGWSVDITRDLADSHAFPLNAGAAEVNKNNVVTKKTPQVDEVFTSQLTARAKFGVPESLQLPLSERLGVLKFNPQNYESNFTRLCLPQRNTALLIDFNVVPVYQVSSLVPDGPSLAVKTMRWVEKKNREPEDAVARFVVFQLSRYQQYGLRETKNILKKLVTAVMAKEPDFWVYIQLFMIGKISIDNLVRQTKASNGNQVIVPEPLRSEQLSVQ